ncbi:type VI secretion system tip protein TssI/VgrG [Roseibium sp. HPY-6]|uniref:type VI secretion system Vgr family protein n=1 Tax=Roseibium sp. HPY-6 TaxID=3229852 RepID=UPI00338F841C
MATGQLRQTDRMAELTSVFGDDVLSLVTIDCDEGLSEEFEIRLEVVSQQEDLDFNQALATHMTVKVKTNNGDIRYFDGLLTDAKWLGHKDGYYRYKLMLRPWYWLLTKNSNCRMFKEKSAPDIIAEVLGEHDFADFQNKLTESYDPIHYCVQYRESDYDFCCRLMEEFGISYCFEHQDGKHMMILADAKSSYSQIEGDPNIPFIPLAGDSQRDEEHLYDWVGGRTFRTGKFAVNDYDFEKPSASLEAEKDAGSPYRAGSLEKYDYPGRYTEKDKGTKYSNIRLEAEQAGDNRVETAGEVPRFYAGGLFTLKEHPHGPQNKEYLIVRASHQIITESYRSGESASQGEAYTGTYEVLSADIPFRTPANTPKPSIPGPQTAKVVGQGEIDVDEYGQIMVEFHWDRDKTQSRRVRVAQVVSGKNWGGVYIPRVGQEVIIQFLEGDPDQPIVIGTVYNAENMPPYPLPGEKNKSGIKTDSTVGGGGYNEFVLDDTKGQEKIGIHGQKDMETVIENNDHLHVKNNRTTKVDMNREEEVGVNVTEDIGMMWTVEAGMMIKFKCGNSTITMTPTMIQIKSLMVQVKADTTMQVQGTMTQVNGTANHMVQGGVVLIN